jgi:hypothetical protein
MEENMEKIEVRTEPNHPQAPATVREIVVQPGECPTCISGADPTLGGNLFQEALREGL